MKISTVPVWAACIAMIGGGISQALLTEGNFFGFIAITSVTILMIHRNTLELHFIKDDE